MSGPLIDYLCSPPPDIATAGGTAYRVTGNTATTKMKIPKVLTEFPKEELVELLKEAAEVSDRAQFVPDDIKPDPFMILDNEAAVVWASTLHLVHPVNVALQHLLPGLLLSCEGEYSGADSRYDLCWIVNGRPILVLEFKHRASINWADFSPAHTSSYLDSNGSPAPPEYIRRLGRAATLTGNAPILTQQAAKYSSRCPLILLCDWDNLVITQFYPGGQPYDDLKNPLQCSHIDPLDMTFKAALSSALLWSLWRHSLLPANWPQHDWRAKADRFFFQL